MAELLKGKNLEKRQGSTYTKVDPAKHLQGKVVALYFSAHWCPPCRAFTPVLKIADSRFEIVFVSSDDSEAEMKSYMNEAHGNWCVIPFGDPEIEELKTRYEIPGIPTLIIISSDGDVIAEDGRVAVEGAIKGPAGLFNEWKEEASL